MKRILLSLIAAFSSFAFGATNVPVQLLNPTGSTSGQAIVSTGSSTAPAWGNISIATLTGVLTVANGGTNASSASGTALDNITGFSGTGFLTRTGAGAYAFQSATNGITLGNLAQVGANTVLANATASSANLAAFSMPSCSTSASALNWTTSTGFTCNTSVNAATLSGNATGTSGTAVPLLSGANTWGGAQTFSAIVTPSTTNGIKGTTAADNANAGSIGEVISANTASAVSLTTGTAANIVSITLTAGDWDVTGLTLFSPASTTVASQWFTGISTTSGAFQTVAGALGNYTEFLLSAGQTNVGQQMIAPVTRVNVSTSTTVYLIGEASFNTSTMTGYGFIRARRVR